MVSCWPTSCSSRYPQILSLARLTNRIVLCSSMTIMASEAVSTIVLQTSRSCKPHLEGAWAPEGWLARPERPSALEFGVGRVWPSLGGLVSATLLFGLESDHAVR